MTRAEKQKFLHAQLHMAWGHAKDSPEYDKACWRVLAAVIERLCDSREPHAEVLDTIEFGDPLLGLEGGKRR